MKNKLQIGKHILAVTAKEVTWSLIAANLYPLGLLQHIRSNNNGTSSLNKSNTQMAKPSSPLHTRPVLLVHGIAHNASAFIRMKTKMQKRGWLHVFTMNYSTINKKLIEMVDELSWQVDKVLEVTKAPQIDIVAHSLGGIVSRYYMSSNLGKGKVKNLVTLGAPHKGTYLSPLLRTLALNKNLSKDLYTNSSFLKDMQQKTLPKNSTITSIYSKYDWTVWPQDNCFVEGSPSSVFKNIKVDFVSHISLLYNSRVFQHIVSALKS